ncbi:MAG TPA: PqqD family peptide modification chaperone, partial [Candidatus Bathyarchaeia archaeon]|nr:PqqD family peptide modification chaperone [Candidatus Bathyarchaeia archaeon]
MQADEFISTPVGNGLLLARRHAHRLFALNESARFVWECHLQNLTPAEMGDKLADAYGIEPSLARRDVDAVLRQWREEGLIESGRPRLACVVGGCRFLLRLGPPDVQDALATVLSSLVCEEAAAFPSQREATIEVTEREGKYLISVDEAAALLAPTLDAVVESVQTGVIRHIFNVTEWQISMHSAAVGRPTGCILIAGESGSGKTTLVARMLDRGFDYLADDLVLVMPSDLAVVPIAMPLVLKRGSWADLDASLPGLNAARVFRRAGRDVKYWMPPRGRIAERPVPIRA